MLMAGDSNVIRSDGRVLAIKRHDDGPWGVRFDVCPGRCANTDRRSLAVWRLGSIVAIQRQLASRGFTLRH